MGSQCRVFRDGNHFVLSCHSPSLSLRWPSHCPTSVPALALPGPQLCRGGVERSVPAGLMPSGLSEAPFAGSFCPALGTKCSGNRQAGSLLEGPQVPGLPHGPADRPAPPHPSLEPA